jgi:hypothetical protein
MGTYDGRHEHPLPDTMGMCNEWTETGQGGRSNGFDASDIGLMLRHASAGFKMAFTDLKDSA